MDREEELRRLRTAVHNGERLFLIGPRRFGKTTLLNVVQRQLEGAGLIVLKYDVEKFESTELLARALLSGAIRSLTSRAEKISAAASQQITRFFGSLKPEITYDVVEQSISVSLGTKRRASESSLPLLTDVLDGIESMAKEKGEPVSVVLDEFQHLIVEGGLPVERQLRAAIQTHEHLSYIFAGSKTRLLTDMTSQHSRPFYRMGSSLFLGPIPREAFTPFLRQGFENHRLKVEEGAIERILDLAEDVPYSVQRLAHRCWERLHEVSPKHRTLTPAFVEDTLERITLEEDPAYTQLWLSLTMVQKKALKAVIGCGGRLLLSKAVTIDYGLSAASMQKAIQALNDRGIIREEQSLGKSRYRLDDPFLATWLRVAQRV